VWTGSHKTKYSTRRFGGTFLLSLWLHTHTVRDPFRFHLYNKSALQPTSSTQLVSNPLCSRSKLNHWLDTVREPVSFPRGTHVQCTPVSQAPHRAVKATHSCCTRSGACFGAFCGPHTLHSLTFSTHELFTKQYSRASEQRTRTRSPHTCCTRSGTCFGTFCGFPSSSSPFSRESPKHRHTLKCNEHALEATHTCCTCFGAFCGFPLFFPTTVQVGCCIFTKHSQISFTNPRVPTQYSYPI
jgi:hypothetical protein